MNSSDITSRWPLPAEGIRFLTPQFLLQELAVHPLSQDLYPIAAGFYPGAERHQMQRRRHDSHLLIYCTDGGGQLRTGNATWPVNKGDLVSLPRGRAHSYQANRDLPWTIYWIHYDGNLAATFNQFFMPEPPLAHIGLQPKLLADFEAIFALRRAGYALAAFVHAACQLKQMLSQLNQLVSHHGKQPGQAINLNQLQELMHIRLDRQLDLDALAAEANLSKYHFARKFKQLTGHSPIQHFIHMKIQHACQLLDTSEDSVKRIAFAVGYQDAYYFSRLFKQVMGLSPSQYRSSRQT